MRWRADPTWKDRANPEDEIATVRPPIYDTDGQPIRSFRTLLDHLATLTRNDLHYGPAGTGPIVPTLAEPTPTQRRVFELLDTTIALTLK